MRTEVFYKKPEIDGRGEKIKRNLENGSCSPEWVSISDVYLLENIPGLGEEDSSLLFADQVAQQACHPLSPGGFYAAEASVFEGWNLLVEISYKPGVTDPVAITARTAVEDAGAGKLPPRALVQTARQYIIKERNPDKNLERILKELHNPLIEQAVYIFRREWEKGKRPPAIYPHTVSPSPAAVEEIDLTGANGRELEELSRKRLLALTPEEMSAVQAYYRRAEVREKRRAAGLGPAATDVELEMIAQTWSEHCKHKIFQAEIRYSEGEETQKIDSLFSTYIKAATERAAEGKDFLRSVFHDNSGVVRFDDDYCVCFKAETHNSPSALDPYGGAITGIVGVNRDIMGTGKGAKPIFNTNVLCFGEPDTRIEDIPEGLIHPKQVLHGVHHGIIDGGNQSGIPVAAGAFLFDESYTGKPLVFCGTGGILPAEINGEGSWIKHIEPGHKAVMLGGRIGKDGIHGATFSSLVLSEESPTSAVQIGDPITQKKMLDFLLEARDKGLYQGITDNGAGGLSSSLGEMAEESGGVRIELDLCPLKYEGLSPWEILVSESQERMSLSVEPGRIEEFLSLAEKRDVEATVIGEFTDSGMIEILYHGRYVGLLSLEFLHRGLPPMKLKARWEEPARPEEDLRDMSTDGKKLKGYLLDILAEPNVASKERLVRQYDHEVQGMSVGKPFCGEGSDGPSDGGVLKPLYHSWRGITVTHGICPRYSDGDTYHMAMCALDEALRAHVACGGDPDEASALDNFCWPDPVESPETPDGQYKLAQLVRACRGLFRACTDYGVPLISGKDSMKNDARIGDRKVSVRPTLLVSLLGMIPDVRRSLTTDFKAEGDTIYLLGETRGETGGTIFEKILESPLGKVPEVKTEDSLKLYRQVFAAARRGIIRSCHDLSDGGFSVALCESSLGGRLGARVDLDRIPGGKTAEMESARLLFCETPSRFLVTVKEEDLADFEALFADMYCSRVGEVTGDGRVIFGRADRELFSLSLEEIERAWKSLDL